jgi:hypothetical protein
VWYGKWGIKGALWTYVTYKEGMRVRDMRPLDDEGGSEVWRFDKFGSFIEAEDCSSAGGSIDDSEELATPLRRQCVFSRSALEVESNHRRLFD